ncbi:MAG: pyridoxal 5'-phosphate synthase glutaminase subunit PdxT [Actinomycetota bacterium]
MLRVGVLALQGAFREHIMALKSCGAEGYEVRLPHQLEEADGLIIPGGESTTIDKLITKYGFKIYLDNFFKAEKPIFGTCAGMILLADRVVGEKLGLGYIDLTVERNAYGRQVDSFEQDLKLNFNHRGKGPDFRAIFIRAPRIVEAGKNVQVMGMIGKNAVIARQRNVLVCSFHPELGSDFRIHKYFIDMVKNKKREN